MSQPWIKFYPRDWRGDQAVRAVSLAARGLWFEMLCLMHEATPYGHLVVGALPVEVDALARIVGTGAGEVQALLVELSAAGVFRRTRAGVIFSKRMTDDHKRSVEGKKAKLAALAEAAEKAGKNPPPSRPPDRDPPTQKPEARVKVEGHSGPSTLNEAKNDFVGPKEVRDAFAQHFGEPWLRSYFDPCGWQDVPERTLIPASSTAAKKIRYEARRVVAELGLTVLDRRATA